MDAAKSTRDSSMMPIARLATALEAARSAAAAAGCFYVQEYMHPVGKGLVRMLPAARALTGLFMIPRGHWPGI